MTLIIEDEVNYSINNLWNMKASLVLSSFELRVALRLMIITGPHWGASDFVSHNALSKFNLSYFLCLWSGIRRKSISRLRSQVWTEFFHWVSVFMTNRFTWFPLSQSPPSRALCCPISGVFIGLYLKNEKVSF